jgi:uncharacterized membrane protein
VSKTRWLLALALALLWPATAHADLKLCNRTSYILYAATAQVANGARQTQGWTRIVPGDCQTAVKGALSPQGIAVYARSSLAHSGPQRAWGGKVTGCVRDSNFTLRQNAAAPSCTAPDSFSMPFAAIDTGGRGDFTMNLDDQPALPSLLAAQLAGVKRLLKDNGYPIPAITGTPDKATGKALTQFRAAMHFAPDDGNDVLFQRLESQAQKSVVPAGFTVCNDGKDDLLVAMAENSAKGPVSRGWWRVAAGACARTMTAPLKTDAVWLLAQKPNGTAVLSGPDRFCIAPQEFEIARRGDCAGQGQTQAGFAKTATRGLSGYVAHVK